MAEAETFRIELFRRLNELGYFNPDAMHRILSTILGRDVAALNTLTGAEARRVLRYLEAREP